MVLVLVKTFHSLPPLLKVEAALLSTKHLPCCTAGTKHARVQRGAFALTTAKPLSQTQMQSEGVHLQIFLLLATNHSSGRSQKVKKKKKRTHPDKHILWWSRTATRKSAPFPGWLRPPQSALSGGTQSTHSQRTQPSLQTSAWWSRWDAGLSSVSDVCEVSRISDGTKPPLAFHFHWQINNRGNISVWTACFDLVVVWVVADNIPRNNLCISLWRNWFDVVLPFTAFCYFLLWHVWRDADI